MGYASDLICWEENGEKKWEMVKEKDRDAYLMNLLSDTTNNINPHSVFIIPTNGMCAGIWLFPKTHKSNRVDFWNFFEDYGEIYKKPEVSEQTQKFLDNQKEKSKPDTKYGFISPDGRYFHCGFQGHSSLADRICFGMTDTNNAERYLEEHGWCKIYRTLFSNQYAVYVGGDKEITDAQMDTLIKMGLDTAEGIANMLCKNQDLSLQ